ncbi:MAG: rhomboid family intramembrane serine protease [Candidatus Omnitrophica bacterium]|nr:rhomboid family intramembrane serine protease [Candidatus Omnitrophota bacterium]
MTYFSFLTVCPAGPPAPRLNLGVHEKGKSHAAEVVRAPAGPWRIMRIIGQLNTEAGAQSFGDFLYVQGIKNEIEARADGNWVVWVYAEDELERAKDLLARYQKNPADPEVANAADKANQLRVDEEKDEVAARKRYHDRARLLPWLTHYGGGWLTVTLIVISVVVTLLYAWGRNPGLVLGFFITKSAVGGSLWDRLAGLTEIWHGQVWRLITPIFIHFGVLHLLFDMWWLYDLGSMIEYRLGHWYLALIVLVVAVCSNLGQYLATGPAFGGMSGVVYGLLGYIWIRGKIDPLSGLFLHPQTVMVMIVWFFLCLFGIIGSVANVAHAVGLVMGMAWGFLAGGGLRQFGRL